MTSKARLVKVYIFSLHSFQLCVTNRLKLAFALYQIYVTVMSIYEPRCEKTGFFAYAKTNTQISFAVTAKLISAFVFAIRIVQSLYYLNPKFQASNHLRSQYSLVCVGPGRKPRRPFSQNEAHIIPMVVVMNYEIKEVNQV